MFEELHELIQAFTTKELRRLEHFLNVSSTDHAFQYQLLFTCLYNMGDVFQMELIEDFAEEHSIDHEALRAGSYQLYDRIMLYLRDPKVRPDPVWVIECLLEDAKILKLKNLYTLSFKKLEKALKIAQKNNLPELEYKIRLAYCSTLVKQGGTEVVDGINEHLQLAQKAWGRLNKSEGVIQINHQAYMMWLAQSPDIEDLAGKVNLRRRSIPQQLGFFAQLRYTQTRVLLAMKEEDSKECFYWQQKAMDLFELGKDLSANFPFEYLATIANYQAMAFSNGQWGIFKKCLQELQTMPAKEPFLQILRDGIVHQMELNFWLNHFNELYELDRSRLNAIVDFIRESKGAISASQLATMTYSLALAFFYRNEHTEARYWWTQIEMGRYNRVRPEHQRMISTLSLINDYADEDYKVEQVAANIDTVRRRLHNFDPKNQGLLTHEKITVRHVRKLNRLYTGDKGGRQEQLMRFNKEIVELQQNSNGNGVYSYSPIIWWLDNSAGRKNS